MNERSYYVYIMRNQWHTVFYTGMSGRGEMRFWEHREKTSPKSFTARYTINKVVFIESFSTPTEAAEAEHRIKKWSRKKKKALIESINPEWKEMSESSTEGRGLQSAEPNQ